MDDATFHEGVPANFKGVISACQVSPLVKYGEYSWQRGLFEHRRLHDLGGDKGYLPIGLFGNPTNWYGADGTGAPPLSRLIPDLRPIMDRHRGLQLLLDYSWEAGLGDAFFPGVDAFVRDLGIPPERAVVVVSNQGIEERYRRFLRAGQRSPSACFRVIGADLWLMYSAIELQRKHWYESPESLVRDADVDERRRTHRDAKFLSFNRRPRWHRFLLALMLGELGLDAEGFVSMSSPRYHGDWIPEDDKVDSFGALMARDDWNRLEQVRDRVFATLPWTVDIAMDEDSGLPEQYLYRTQARRLFVDSYSQVITESYMEGEPEDVFITEKTCRALANLQPFAIFGHPGSLRRLKQHGFETSSFFDDAYDGISDLGHRLTELYAVLRRLKSAAVRDVHERYHAELDLHRFNRERLFEMPGELSSRLACKLRAELWAP